MAGSIFLIAALAVAAPQVQVGLLNGSATSGEVVAFAPNLTLKTEQGDTTLPLETLLSIAPKDAPLRLSESEKPIAWIELVDGSKLTADKFEVGADDAALISLGLNSTVAPKTVAIRTVRFSRPDDPASPAWPENIGVDASGDLMAIRKNDHVDFLEGRIGEVAENRITLRVDGENYPTNRNKIDGLVYFHKTGPEFPNPLCVVETTSGWKLKAKSVELAKESPLALAPKYDAAAATDKTATGAGGVPENVAAIRANGWLKVTTLSGVVAYVPWNSVSRLDFSAGKIVYVSDLEPDSVQWTPYIDFGKSAPALAQYYALRRDMGREQQSLAIGGKNFAKGLSIYSRTAVVYRLPSGMKKFKATAGIDDAGRETGKVRLEISADGKKLFDKPIDAAQPPEELELDIAGAKRLTILVDYGDGQDLGDFLDLADARMLK